MQKTNKNISPLSKALKYLSYRHRSSFEIQKYLLKKGFEEKEIIKTVKKLKELNFIDDKEFSKNFISSKQLKGKSKRLIYYELKLKGVEKEIINKSIDSQKSDLETALSYIKKRRNIFNSLDDEIKKKKLVNRLRSRGFSWDIINKVLKNIKF